MIRRLALATILAIALTAAGCSGGESVTTCVDAWNDVRPANAIVREWSFVRVFAGDTVGQCVVLLHDGSVGVSATLSVADRTLNEGEPQQPFPIESFALEDGVDFVVLADGSLALAPS